MAFCVTLALTVIARKKTHGCEAFSVVYITSTSNQHLGCHIGTVILLQSTSSFVMNQIREWAMQMLLK
jgi:hypothetical protein